ncbi:MAG: hypothetical protein ACOCV9_03745 [Marinilabiliaceae bacterium]
MTYNEENWDQLVLEVSKRFSVTADFDFMLFLMGVQERGEGMRSYSREEKMDLINLGKCTALARAGYLEENGYDEEGWPLFREKDSLKSLTPSLLNYTLKRSVFDYLIEKLNLTDT